MKINWRINDLIDLEFFLFKKDRDDQIKPDHSDREIYLAHIEPVLKKEKNTADPGRFIIRCWLDQKKKMAKQALDANFMFPGDLFYDAYRLFQFLFGFLGIFIGTGLAFTLLTYQGENPINVSLYLGIFVIMQILLVLVLIGSFLCRRLFRFLPRIPVAYHLLSLLLAGIIQKIKSKTEATLSAQQRNAARTIAGLLKEKKSIYGTVSYWPFFIVAQIFGIGFNVGILSATFLRILGSDLAFGWQSTVRFSTETVYHMVEFLAAPWNGFVPPHVAHPTPHQIEGSRIVLKEGIYRLATTDLTAWWPFLCLSVLFYGLLPRIILLIAGYVLQYRALNRIDFHHRTCDQLIRRMLTPIVTTSGISSSRQSPALRQQSASPLKQEMVSHQPTQLVPLIHEDIFDRCKDEELQTVARHIGDIIHEKKIKITGDFDEDKPLFDMVSEAIMKDEGPDILLLQEAWQPPIQETYLFLKELRRYFSTKTKIHVGLIGKPAPDSIFTEVEDRDFIIWEQALFSLGDPYVIPGRLVNHD